MVIGKAFACTQCRHSTGEGRQAESCSSTFCPLPPTCAENIKIQRENCETKIRTKLLSGTREVERVLDTCQIRMLSYSYQYISVRLNHLDIILSNRVSKQVFIGFGHLFSGRVPSRTLLYLLKIVSEEVKAGTQSKSCQLQAQVINCLHYSFK